MTAMIAQCQTWCDTVDWSSLGRSEFVFAERLTEPMKVGGSLSIGPPDLVGLFRQDEETALANYEGTSGILRGVVEQISALSGDTSVARPNVSMIRTSEGRADGTAAVVIRIPAIPAASCDASAR